MREADVARLLTIAAAVDNRRLDGLAGQAALAAWGDVLRGFEFDECREAIREHRLSAPGVYLEPGHIAQLVLRARAAGPSPEESWASLNERIFEDFLRFTGLPRPLAAAHWNEPGWREAREAEARVASKQAAIESGMSL